MSLLRMLAFRPAGAGSSGQGSNQPAKAKIAEAAAKPSVLSAAPDQSSEDQITPSSATENTETKQQSMFKQEKEPEDWEGILPTLNLQGPVRELARNIQLESKNGDKWQFLIPDTVRHLGSDTMVQKLQTALSSRLGHDVNLAVHTANEAVVTPAVLGEKATRQRMNEAEKAIEQDPTIQSLKERLGAEVLEDSIQPLQ